MSIRPEPVAEVRTSATPDRTRRQKALVQELLALKEKSEMMPRDLASDLSYFPLDLAPRPGPTCAGMHNDITCTRLTTAR